MKRFTLRLNKRRLLQDPHNALASTPVHLREALIAGFCLIHPVPFALCQPSTEPTFAVVERGEDFAVYQRVTMLAESDGSVRWHTNRLTLLENCMNYFEE